MSFSKLERFEKKVKAGQAEELETLKRRELRRAVKSVIPKSVRTPTRPKGRTAAGGLTRKEVAELRRRALLYLDGEAGVEALQLEVQRQAIVILLIDGVLGTEPWRASGGPHGGIIAANARLRYLENAGRLLEDLRRSRGDKAPNDRLLEGVIDAEVVS